MTNAFLWRRTHGHAPNLAGCRRGRRASCICICGRRRRCFIPAERTDHSSMAQRLATAGGNLGLIGTSPKALTRALTFPPFTLREVVLTVRFRMVGIMRLGGGEDTVLTSNRTVEDMWSRTARRRGFPGKRVRLAAPLKYSAPVCCQSAPFFSGGRGHGLHQSDLADFALDLNPRWMDTMTFQKKRRIGSTWRRTAR